MQSIMEILGVNPSLGFEEQFREIAFKLFSEYELVVNDSIYEFIELEFYCYSIFWNHPDPYVHKSDKQLEFGKWYFHGSGIDITFGDKASNSYCGILIRGLKKHIGEEKFISGPLNVASEIFQQFGSVDLTSISLGIRKRNKIRELPAYDFVSSTRINLPRRNDDNVYREKHYRFLTHICPEHPFKEKGKVAQILIKDNPGINIITKFGYKIL